MDASFSKTSKCMLIGEDFFINQCTAPNYSSFFRFQSSGNYHMTDAVYVLWSLIPPLKLYLKLYASYRLDVGLLHSL